MDDDDGHNLQIVVVGPCAAGKSTLVNNLGSRGFNIKACTQEHSFVPQLWKKFSHADVLIYLDVDLPTIASRQNRSDWTQQRLAEQQRRLTHARAHCDFYLKTDDLTRKQVADTVDTFLRTRGIRPRNEMEHED
jgi:guanylate kinase